MVLVFLPLGSVGGILSYLLGNLGIPTGKDVVCAGRGTVERRGIDAGQEVSIHLIGKDFLVFHTVSVSHGVLRSHAQDIVLGRSVHRSPRAIFPFQVDNDLLFTGFAGIGNVRTLRNVQLGIKLLHIFVEGIDLHFAVVSAMYNAERAVDQTEGLAAVAGFVVGADDLYRIVAQQLLDFFLAGLRGRGVAFNVNLSGRNQPFRRRPPLQILVPIQIIDNTGNFTFRIRADITGMILTIKISKILIQINFNCATPLTTFTLLFITYTVIAVLQTIAVIVVNGSLTNELNNHLIRAKDKVLAQFWISGCCITYNIKDDRSVSRSDPLCTIVSQCDGFRGSISSGKGVARNCFIVLIHILRCIHRDRASVRAGAALNVTNGKRTVQQGICLISVVNTGVDAVNCHHVCTQQVFDVISAGLAGLSGGGIWIFRYEINRSALVAGGRTALVKRPRCGICVGFFRPTDDLVTAVDTCTISCCLDVTDSDCVIIICRVAVRRRILANKLRLFRRTVIVANSEFVPHIQDSEGNIDLMSCIQLRQCVERQQTENHDK